MIVQLTIKLIIKWKYGLFSSYCWYRKGVGKLLHYSCRLINCSLERNPWKRTLLQRSWPRKTFSIVSTARSWRRVWQRPSMYHGISYQSLQPPNKTVTTHILLLSLTLTHTHTHPTRGLKKRLILADENKFRYFICDPLHVESPKNRTNSS